MAKITFPEVPKWITEELQKYSDDVLKAVHEEAKKIGRKTARQLKMTSPVRTGRYRASWGTTQRADFKGQKVTVIIHNKKHYRLTHLLEHGHLIRNQYGQYVRKRDGGSYTRKNDHINEAGQQAMEEYIKACERRIKRGV